jgi:hypothetical protein
MQSARRLDPAGLELPVQQRRTSVLDHPFEVTASNYAMKGGRVGEQVGTVGCENEMILIVRLGSEIRCPGIDSTLAPISDQCVNLSRQKLRYRGRHRRVLREMIDHHYCPAYGSVDTSDR